MGYAAWFIVAALMLIPASAEIAYEGNSLSNGYCTLTAEDVAIGDSISMTLTYGDTSDKDAKIRFILSGGDEDDTVTITMNGTTKNGTFDGDGRCTLTFSNVPEGTYAVTGSMDWNPEISLTVKADPNKAGYTGYWVG